MLRYKIGTLKSQRDGSIAADYVVFPDGTMVTRWRGPNKSTVVWNDQADAEAIHCKVGNWYMSEMHFHLPEDMDGK